MKATRSFTIQKHHTTVHIVLATLLVDNMKSSTIATLVFLVGLGTAHTVGTSRTSNDILARQGCGFGQYKCRYGFCCRDNEQCEPQGCSGGKSTCSNDGETCEFGCCKGTSCGSDKLCHCNNPKSCTTSEARRRSLEGLRGLGGLVSNYLMFTEYMCVVAYV